MKNKLFTLNKLFLFGVALLLCSCASKEIKPQKPTEQQVYTSNNILFYEGEITLPKNKLLFSLYEPNQSLKTLEINSTGGDVTAGIELGNWLFDNKLDVKIGALCASSCANYIFPAGKRKIIQKHSLLLWHGSSYQPNIVNLVKSGDSFANKWRKLEEIFFKKVGINYRISTCGLSQASIGAKILHNLNIINLKGYDYSIKDMQKFGIDGIVLLNQDWLGTTKFTFNGIFRADYC